MNDCNLCEGPRLELGEVWGGERERTERKSFYGLTILIPHFPAYLGRRRLEKFGVKPGKKRRGRRMF